MQGNKPTNEAELRKLAHETLDKYLDNGGPTEFVIMSANDYKRNYTDSNMEVSDGLLGNNSSDKDGIGGIV